VEEGRNSGGQRWEKSERREPRERERELNAKLRTESGIEVEGKNLRVSWEQDRKEEAATGEEAVEWLKEGTFANRSSFFSSIHFLQGVSLLRAVIKLEMGE
jgi:hypothetical protein